MDCFLPPSTVIPVGKSHPPSLCPLPPYNISTSPRPFSALTQTDPPRLLSKILGGNISQTILTGERINKFCPELHPPSPRPPTQLRREITSSSRREFILFLFFLCGRRLGGAGSQGTDSPPPLERIQFPPLVTAVNTPNDGWSPGSCMGVIGVLVTFFPSEVGGRARAQGLARRCRAPPKDDHRHTITNFE